MNKENIQTLIDKLSSIKDEEFSISDWNKTTPCGTVACIGGWASILAGYFMSARNWLELSEQQHIDLCCTFRYSLPDGGSKLVDRKFAIALLQDLLSTGKINHENTFLRHQTELEKV